MVQFLDANKIGKSYSETDTEITEINHQHILKLQI